ncbi:hypothetical protein NEPAR08_2205 [Nematocida parisii]|nr:hypothetical protein NEPAR03_1853 [Nematocida parisii]KAI5130740.1 hypothetical protein NEPAR08_2205 [Nematocida parisii]
MQEFKEEKLLRKELQKSLGDYEYREIKTLNRIVMDMLARINDEVKIFSGIPEQLVSLANNSLLLQVYQRTDLIYSEDAVVSVVGTSINYIKAVIDKLVAIADNLQDNDKKEALYNLIGGSHLFMAYFLCNYRKQFFTENVNTLCELHGIPKLNEKTTSNYALVSLFELTESKKCSKLQRALDIIMKHGNDLFTIDETGLKTSNASKLGISNDDIKALQLLTRVEYDSVYNLMWIAYRSISIENKNTGQKMSFDSLYDLIFGIFTNYSIKDIELYKENKNCKFNEFMNAILNIGSINILYSGVPNNFHDIFKPNLTTFSKFENNVIHMYAETEKEKFSIINSTSTAKPSIEDTTEVSSSTETALEAKENRETSEPVTEVPTRRSRRDEQVSLFLTVFVFLFLIANSAILINLIGSKNSAPTYGNIDTNQQCTSICPEEESSVWQGK